MSTTNDNKRHVPIVLPQYQLINRTPSTIVIIDVHGTSIPIPASGSITTNAITPSILAYEELNCLSIIRQGLIPTSLPQNIDPTTTISGGYSPNNQEAVSLATDDVPGLIKPGAGHSIDISGSLVSNLGPGLTINEADQIVPDPEHIDVSTLKNFDTFSKGVYVGPVPAALTGLINAVRGQFWIADPAIVLDGINFNLGDQLFCVADVNGTPTNLTNFARVPFTGNVLKGATPSKAGLSGLVPPPTSGKQLAFLRGDATWQHLTQPYSNSLSYSTNQLALLNGLVIKANDDILANTNFAWGTTKATWSLVPQLPNQLWVGVWVPNVAYSAGFIVADSAAATARLWICTGSISSSLTTPGTLGIDANKWLPLNAISEMTPATSKNHGSSGLVPAPLAGQHRLALLGDGTFGSVQGNAPKWNDGIAYNQYDLVTYTDGFVYYANSDINPNTPFIIGSRGATWSPAFPTNTYCRFSNYGEALTDLVSLNSIISRNVPFTLLGASNPVLYTSSTGGVTISQPGDYEASITIQIQNRHQSLNSFQLALNTALVGTVFTDQGYGLDGSNYHNLHFTTCFSTNLPNQILQLFGKTTVSGKVNGYECVLKKVA